MPSDTRISRHNRRPILSLDFDTPPQSLDLDPRGDDDLKRAMELSLKSDVVIVEEDEEEDAVLKAALEASKADAFGAPSGGDEDMAAALAASLASYTTETDSRRRRESVTSTALPPASTDDSAPSLPATVRTVVARPKGSINYGLGAVLKHRGMSQYSGHYVTQALEKGVWRMYNDSEVREMKRPPFATIQGYIVRYDAAG